MAGHVFHPGHHELHGVTVVLETNGPRTYLGRFDSQDQRGVVMHDVGVHDSSAGASSREEYLTHAAKFGIRAEHKHVLIPGDQVVRITRFTDMVGQT